MPAKSRDYNTLVQERKRCWLCEDGLVNPATVSGGPVDRDEVGPWTWWQGNLDAALMVVGQDWGTVKWFREYSEEVDARNYSNRAMKDLLESMGVRIGLPGDPEGQSIAFFTNAVLCLKPDDPQDVVKDWRQRCSTGSRDRQDSGIR